MSEPACPSNPPDTSEPVELETQRPTSEPAKIRNPIPESEVSYGRTPIGQLLYDLAFTNLASEYLARKHRKPVGEIRRLRAHKDIRKLRKQNRLKEHV